MVVYKLLLQCSPESHRPESALKNQLLKFEPRIGFVEHDQPIKEFRV